jgi:hypothetical protein
MTSPAPGQAAQPSPAIMSRLAFIRLFFQQGIDQSRQPEPLNVSSVLTLHDTAELFLQVIAEVIAERRGVKLPRFISFPEYWKLLDPARDPNGVAISGERPMTRLNDLRIAFKHHGTLPSSTAVAQACTDVRAFLEANTLTVFGMPFETIDMAEVIPQTGVRDKVRAATAAAGGGDLTEAMGLLAEAYDELFGIAPGSTVPSRIARFGDTIKPTAERDLAAALQPAPGDRTRRPVGADPRRLASAIADLMKATRDMQLAMRVTALGIDFRQFARFTQLMPSIGYYADGHSERHTPPGYAPTSTDFEFCRQFVITAALRIAEEP